MARIASPMGLTSVAGPGRTTMAIPMSRTVKPTTATMSLLICFNVRNGIGPLILR